MRGRGCGFPVSLLVCVWASVAAAVEVPVPSGQPVSLNEVLLDTAPGELWVRFRFIAPHIARETGLVSYEQAGPDMDALCQDVALPYLDHHEIEAARVVISLSDQRLPFGSKDRTATQFFEAYRPENEACIWEEF